jgi:hypothetical protein
MNKGRMTEQRLLDSPQCARRSNARSTVARACSAAIVLLAVGYICCAQEVPAATEQPTELVSCGLFSDSRVRPLVLPHQEPTVIRIMTSRYRDLLQAQDGYNRTGLYLVAYDGTDFVPAGFSDDSGMYYYILLIERWFHLSFAQSVSAFFVSVLVASCVVGSVGLVRVLRSRKSKILALPMLAGLALLAYRLGDVYVFEFAVPIAFVPWIWWQIRQHGPNWRAAALLVVAGLVVGWATTVRTVAGIPTLLVVLVLVATQFKVENKRKIAFISLVLAGVLSPILFLRHVENKRDAFLLSHTGIQPENLRRHMFWHLAYTGLGFVSNPYVPGGVCDDVAKAKVLAIAPDAPYLSRRYDEVLRHEVVAIASEHLSVVFFNVAAKLGVVVLIVAIFGSVGLVTIIVWPVGKKVWAIFLPALVVCVAPVILLAPSPPYLMGVITLSAMAGVFCLDEALQPAFAAVPQTVRLEHRKYVVSWGSVKRGTSV